MLPESRNLGPIFGTIHAYFNRSEEWQEEISSKWYDLEPRPHMTQSRCATSISSNLAGNLCLDHVKRAISWHGTLSCVLWRALSRLQEMPSRFGKSALISISRGLSTRAPMCGRGHQSSIFSSQAWIGARFLNRGIPLWSPAPVKLVWRDWKFCHCMEGMNAKSVAPRALNQLERCHVDQWRQSTFRSRVNGELWIKSE